MTDAHAEKALRLILDLLPRAINEEKRDPAILQKLIEASTVANLACGCAGLGLVHAVRLSHFSRPMIKLPDTQITTSPEVPLAHGYQNGCVLLQVANFNRAVMTEEHAALVDGLSTLFTKLGWTGKFQTGEITKARADLMVKASTGHPFRLNNARESTDEDIYAILRASGAEC